MIYELAATVIVPAAKAYWRPHVEGLDNVPLTGGVLIASNHIAFTDSVVIPILAPRKVVFLAKKDYFEGTGIKGKLIKTWFEAIDMVPVDRSDTKAAIDSLDIALEVLGRGDAFGIYPEGTRSRDGLLYRGRTGVAHLALTAGVPVVPVGVQGTEHIQQPGSSRLHRAKVTVKFGKPIDFAGRFDGVPLGRARREATDEIMAAIQELSGQVPAGRYNEPPASA